MRKFHENAKCENIFVKCKNMKISRKCENFVKTMSFIAATINCSKELVEFSALIAQYLKFYYVIYLFLYFNKCLKKRIWFHNIFFKFMSVRSQYIRWTVIFALLFRENFAFLSQNSRIILIAKRYIPRERFLDFRIFYLRKFTFFVKQIEAKFLKNFAKRIFLFRWKL